MPHPFAHYLDFANHRADATPADIENVCAKVLEHSFHAAFVNACYIPLAKKTGVRVGTVVSFPLGQDTLAAKRAATNEAVQLGADELDIVPNIGNFDIQELKEIVDSARMVGREVIIKFILDPGFCTPDELAERSQLIRESGADFVKIGSGMGPRNPTPEDVAIVKQAVPGFPIKVAGGITTYEQARSFIDAGVTRIGTSHAVEILAGANQ